MVQGVIKMTVEELIKELKEYDPNKEVLVPSTYRGSLSNHITFREGKHHSNKGKLTVEG